MEDNKIIMLIIMIIVAGGGGRVLYHISFDTNNIIYKFEPRIQEEILESENSKMRRICVSDSIENCLSAIPRRDEILKDFIIKQVYGNLPKFVIYEFNKIKVQSNNLLSSSFIKQYVPDAEINNELWIVNQEVIPDKISFVSLISFKDVQPDNGPSKITDVVYKTIRTIK